MKRKAVVFLCIILLAVHTVSAQELPDLFVMFLAIIVERNKELETLIMPEVEVKTDPNFEDAYLLTFKSAKDAGIFFAVLEKENIPHGMFPARERQVFLFHSDIVTFIMKTFIPEGE